VAALDRHDEEGNGLAEELDFDALHKRIEEQQAARDAEAAATLKQRYALIRPFGAAATEYVRQIQDEDRFYLHLKGVDAKTRGHGRGELCYVTGRPHSGKTQVVLNAVHNNSDKFVLMFTPDESPELVLAKLIAIRHGIPSDALEERVKVGDPEAIRLVQHAASSEFRRLIVIDAGLRLEQMGQALDEAEDYWQEQCNCCIYDYLELLPGDSGFNGVAAKSQAMKAWVKKSDTPMLCMHQGKKGEGGTRGQAQGMDGMRFGGDSEAIVVLEVYRKRDNRTLTEWERAGHQNTITVNVAKNKRPPMKLGETDLHMDPETGFIRIATHLDLVRDGKPTTSAAEMLAAGRKDING
jgi:replicative DNA helicase